MLTVEVDGRLDVGDGRRSGVGGAPRAELAGAAADRFNKKRILLFTQSTTMAMHLTLAVLVLTGTVQLWQIYVSAMIAGAALAFARAVGEFGAVSVVSGEISGQTETLPLFVSQQFEQFNLAGAYGASILLALLALTTLLLMNLLKVKEGA